MVNNLLLVFLDNTPVSNFKQLVCISLRKKEFKDNNFHDFREIQGFRDLGILLIDLKIEYKLYAKHMLKFRGIQT